MERSLREVNGSLLVTIPKPMARSLGWRAGDILRFTEYPDRVTVRRSSADQTGQTVFTIGYEGRDLDEVMALLEKHGVEQLIDVRERPVSRKKGFSKNKLAGALDDSGIAYVHLGDLGSPKAARSEYRERGDFDKFERKYEAHIAHKTQSMRVLRSLIRTATSALLCFELDWQACHRGILTRQISNDDLLFRHL